MNKKPFWYFMMCGSVVLYGATVALGYYLFPGNPVASWSLFILLFLTHAGETLCSVGIGRRRGVPALRAVVLTLIFGFTWWLPLKRGIIDR